MEGETVLRALHDVIAAKGYEKNTMFREVAQLIGALPRLEGTVHVNVGLVLKFMPNYMFNPAEYPEIGTRNDPADDEFFWNQGPTRGAAKVQFADWTPVYEKHSSIPNVARFYEQAQAFKTLLATAAPDAEQQQGPGLPARRRAPVLADRLRAADPRAGRADRPRRRHRRPDLRLPDPRLLHVCRCAARQAELDAGPAGLGRRRDPQAGVRRRALRPGLGAGQGLRRRLRDAALTAHTGNRRTRQSPRFRMAGQPVTVDHDVELKVEPHRLGHRLPPGNPLSGNDNVPQRHRLALTPSRCPRVFRRASVKV